MTTVPEQAQAKPRRRVGRRMKWTAFLLCFSSLVFCMLVIRQRDSARKDSGMQWARAVETKLQVILDEKHLLPATLQDDSDVEAASLRLAYPSVDELERLQSLEQPFVLVIGARRGLIFPGGDGCPALIFDNGKVHSVWLTMAEVDVAIQKRPVLVSGPANSE